MDVRLPGAKNTNDSALSEKSKLLRELYEQGLIDEATYHAQLAKLGVDPATGFDLHTQEFQMQPDVVGMAASQSSPVVRDKAFESVLVPGDLILQQPISSDHRPATYDPVDALACYLAHVIDDNARLQIQGIRSASALVNIALEEVYITLTATVRKTVTEEEAWIEEMAGLAPGEAKRRGFDVPRETVQQVKVQVQEALAMHLRLVVLGDPGSGKTTLLRYLVLTYARDWADDGTWVKERLGLDERRLPVLLPLRDFARYLERECPDVGADGPRLLLDYLRLYFTNQNLTLPPDFFGVRLKAGECAVFFDGVDEVASSPTRQRIARILEKFTLAYPENRYVVTSRIVGYTGGARLGVDYAVATVRDFTDEDIASFARHWNRAVEIVLAGGETAYALRKAEQEAVKLITTIQQNARVRELSVNPLLLTVIALVQRYRAQLPDRRVELYEEAIEVLLVQWDAVKGLPATEVLQGLELDAGDRRSLLEPVALWLMEQRAREIGLDDLRRQLAAPFQAMLKNERVARKAVDGFIAFINVRSGLLIERGQGIYAFSHLTFQEHLAARAVADRPDNVAYTLARLDDPWWREVVLLEVGYLSTQGKRRATELIRAIMEHVEEPEPYHNLVLAAEAVCDVGQARTEGDLAGEIQARLRQAFTTPLKKGDDLAAQIQQRAAAAEALGKIESGGYGAQPAFWTLPYGEPVWVKIPAGEFWMGSEKGGDQEKPVHKVHLEQYWIAKTPITNAQYRLFVEATGHKAPPHWEGDKIPHSLENHPVVNVSWHDATAYSEWLSKVTREFITLPSEAEWEKAAHGDKNRREYPWGDAWNDGHCNSSELGIEQTTPVGIFPEGASPYGILDMAGNVWEWTCSVWGESERSPQFRYPYNPDDGRENLDAHAAMRRVLRGGAFDNQPKDVRCAYRISNTPSSFGKVMGFRVVRSSRIDPPGVDDVQDKKSRVFYSFAVLPSTKSTHVGKIVDLTATLIPTTDSMDGFELPSHITECDCFLSVEGLQIQSSESAVIRFDANAGAFVPATFKLQAHLCGDRPYTIELFAEDPDSGRISIYKTGGVITVHPPESIEEQPPLLPPLDIRVAPQPDLVLNVATTSSSGIDEMRQLTYYLSSRVPGLRLRNQRVGAVTLRAADYARIQAALQATLQQVAGMQARDARERLLALGKSLFDQCFPPESTREFRQALQQAAGQATTWLIRQDEYIWVPWELLVPYHANENTPLHFLAERYHLSRWVEGLGPPLYSEVPLGEIALAHYKILEAGMEDQDEGLRAWRQLLHAPGVYGILPVVKPETPFYGVHVLYHAGSWLSKRDIIARDSATTPVSPEQEAAEARLHLRLKRPVVTLGMWDDKTMPSGTNAEAWQLPERVLPFLRAGASAVIGPWWPTAEAADRIFWPTFYDLLERRVPLGESVWRARLAVRQALPERPDWLAYALFGDPRARAYWPEPSEGYTVLECLNPDDPLRPGKTYTFRVSLRNRPPIAYTDRLVQPEALPETLRALFLAPGLQTVLAEPVEMTPLGRTMLQATVDLTPPAPGDYPLVVQLLEGDEHVKTLQMTLKVRAAGGSGDD